MTTKTETEAPLERRQMRWIAAQADCDMRTVRDELTVWEAGGDSVSPARARVRATIRAMVAAGQLTSPAVLALLQRAVA